MKKYLKIVIVAVILVFALLVLSGCQNTDNNVNNENSGSNTSLRDEIMGANNAVDYNTVNVEDLEEYTKTEDSNYTTYTASNGASFMYPSNWDSVGTEEEPAFMAPDAKGASVNIAEDIIKEEDNISFPEYIEFQKAYLNQQMTMVQDIDEKIVNLNGRKAYILNYVTESEQEGVKLQLNVTQVAFEDNGSVNILTLAVLNDYYDDLKDTFDKMVKSFTK